jgi:hypothetical protein
VLACAIAVYSVLYAASVDFRLLADTRYEVERWVAAHAKDPDDVIAIGRHHHIARFRWVRWERALEDDGEILRRLQPEMIAVNLTDLRHDEEAAFVARLADGSLGYREVLHAQGRPWIDLILQNDNSSQRFINPEMAVYARIAPAPRSPTRPHTEEPAPEE